MSPPAELHERTVVIDARPIPSDRLEVRAELRDVRKVGMPEVLGRQRPPGVVHHMILEAVLDRDLVVRAIDARMETIPFEPSEKTRGEGCRHILPNYQHLLGTRIDAGYAAHVNETVGGPLGCFHILSMAQCLPLAVRAASGRLCAGARLMPAGGRSAVLDSCASWAADSPHWGEARETEGTGFRKLRRSVRIGATTDERMRLGMAAELTDQVEEVPAIRAALSLWLEVPKFTILEARASLSGAPFALCPATGARAPQLEGLSIAKGFTGAALDRIAGPAGCAHLAALVIAVTPVIPQASGALAAFLKQSPDEMLRSRAGAPQVDSCHMWRAEGPLVNLRSRSG
ncbi:MAG: DUF2889 domain-containing protein [Candidatus Binatia bacterium]